VKTINNKYYKWYYALINRARTRTLTGYGEWHHIIPRSLGGSNDKNNLVHLTAREHLIVHMLLPRFVNNSSPMWCALFFMMVAGKTKTTSKLYEQARIEYIKTRTGVPRSDITRFKISVAKTGKKQTIEHRKNNSLAKTGKPLSPEHKSKVSEALKGRPRPIETRAKISSTLKGHLMSAETISKISATQKGRKRPDISAALKGRKRPDISAALKARKINPEI
jgi:NUMOD3 motif